MQVSVHEVDLVSRPDLVTLRHCNVKIGFRDY